MEERSNKSKLVTGIALLVVGVGLLVWALSGRNAEAPSSGSTTNMATDTPNQVDSSEGSTSESEAETATITFTHDGFSPEELEVKAGTVVTVRNESDTRVQFSSDDHPTHRLNTEMNLRVLNPGESASFAVNTVGTHGFHDHIDDSKTGTLIVTE